LLVSHSQSNARGPKTMEAMQNRVLAAVQPLSLLFMILFSIVSFSNIEQRETIIIQIVSCQRSRKYPPSYIATTKNQTKEISLRWRSSHRETNDLFVVIIHPGQTKRLIVVAQSALDNADDLVIILIISNPLAYALSRPARCTDHAA
jgi:hypothetical protein